MSFSLYKMGLALVVCTVAAFTMASGVAMASISSKISSVEITSAVLAHPNAAQQSGLDNDCSGRKAGLDGCCDEGIGVLDIMEGA